jgi:broad specificity phosphatase PhoE
MKPKRILIVRHGQSEGNVNKQVYNTKPDYSVQLTELGREQAHFAGKQIKHIIGNESVALYSSPYYRTRDTSKGIMESIKPVFYREDPRLREHEWAAQIIDEPKEVWEEVCQEYGVFFYRFKTGESCADVYDRLSTFLDTLHRDFEKKDFPENVVIVAHGMTNRVLLMRWFHWTVEEFELLANPHNCEIYQLDLQSNNKYKLVTEPRKHESLRRKY